MRVYEGLGPPRRRLKPLGRDGAYARDRKRFFEEERIGYGLLERAVAAPAAVPGRHRIE
jgi:hypothetical protein